MIEELIAHGVRRGCLEGVAGKHPTEVAVSIAAQMQSLYYQDHGRPTGASTTWREIKSVLNGEQLG